MRSRTGRRRSIEAALKAALVDGLGLKPRKAFAPVRVAVSGPDGLAAAVRVDGAAGPASDRCAPAEGRFERAGAVG